MLVLYAKDKALGMLDKFIYSFINIFSWKLNSKQSSQGFPEAYFLLGWEE